VSVLLFLYFPYLIFSFFFPAIGKKIRSEKGIFFFCSEFFTYRVNAKNQKNIVTEKEEKHKPGKLLLSYLPGVHPVK